MTSDPTVCQTCGINLPPTFGGVDGYTDSNDNSGPYCGSACIEAHRGCILPIQMRAAGGSYESQA